MTDQPQAPPRDGEPDAVPDDEPMIPLGRRLDALARTRVRASTPRPAWAAPLLVALQHTEEVADVLGERFERAETPPQAPTVLPAELSDLGVPRPGPPVTWAQRQGRVARYRPAPPSGPGTARPAEPWPPGEDWDVESRDDEVREVPADVRSRLRREVGRAADMMRVHTGPDADAQARAADADALTVGRDVYLRQGRWAPRREEGVALLAHEATHIEALVGPGTAWRSAVGDVAEEALARDRERSVLGAPIRSSSNDPLAASAFPAGVDGLAPLSQVGAQQGTPMYPANFTSTAHEQPAAAAASGPPSRAATAASDMRAGVERDLAPAPAATDLDALRRAVIAEVMQRLRSEIERGA